MFRHYSNNFCQVHQVNEWNNKTLLRIFIYLCKHFAQCRSADTGAALEGYNCIPRPLDFWVDLNCINQFLELTLTYEQICRDKICTPRFESLTSTLRYDLLQALIEFMKLNYLLWFFDSMEKYCRLRNILERERFKV